MTEPQPLRLPWFEKTPNSPEFPGDSEGLVIALPERISLRQGGGRVPLFGTVRIREATLPSIGIDDRHPLRAVVVGAILGDANQPYVGNALLQAPLFPIPPSPVVTEYFSVDLVECSGMPRGPGVYFVFASVGPFTAEPRRVEITP